MAKSVSEQVRNGTPVDGVDVLGALSPSRAGDFKTCPLMYRYRTIDKLPEPPSPDAVRGTVVHKVLEDLFDLPAGERTPDRAEAMIDGAWEYVLGDDERAEELFAPDSDPAAQAAWLDSCRTVLRKYFDLEDPTLLEPAERELYVEALLDSKLLLRGFVDRVDVAPNGAIRVVDYKGLALNTRLPTPTGFTTMGEVAIGDYLIGSDGHPTQVTAKSGVHDRPCYRITFRDGSTVVCDNVHLWSVVESRRQEQERRVVSADELFEAWKRLRDDGRTRSLWIDSGSALLLPDRDDLPISPWLLGAWLGDGSTNRGSLTIGKQDLDDMLALVKTHWQRDVRVTEEATSFSVFLSKLPDLCTFGHQQFNSASSSRSGPRCRQEAGHASMVAWNLPLVTELRRAGLRGNKHIPPAYLRAGTEQRIDLLRGLMDTDGWWSKKRRRAGFTTTNDVLARDVIQLLRSLGIHPQHFVKPYTNRVRPDRNWHIVEFTPQDFNPFALPRKALLAERHVTDLQKAMSRRRIIDSIERVESVSTQCIAVDAADSLYLCGEGWIPTHNTGRSPGEAFEAKALFQMRFYALVIWKTRGVIPAMLRLIYLGNGEMVSYAPDEQDLRSTERQLDALWKAIARAHESGDWRPSKSRLCDWCSFKEFCPEWGGTLLPLAVAAEEITESGDLEPGE